MSREWDSNNEMQQSGGLLLGSGWTEPTQVLMELANDLVQGCPMDIGSSLFDDEWDRKYLRAGQ